MLKISTESAFPILHKKLGMKKVFCKWVRVLATMQQKLFNDSDSYLSLVICNKQHCLNYVKLDNGQSAECRAAGESRPKCSKCINQQQRHSWHQFLGMLTVITSNTVKMETQQQHIEFLVRFERRNRKNNRTWRRKKYLSSKQSFLTHQTLQM